MGELYLTMGKLDESVARYKEAIRAERDFYNAYRALAYISALKEEYTESLAWLDSVRAIAPSRGVKGDALAWRTRIYSLMGRFRESERDIKVMADEVRNMRSTEFAHVVDWAGAWLAVERGDLDAARVNMVRYLKGYAESTSHPEYSAALSDVMLAYVDVRSGQLDSARSRLRRARSHLGDAGAVLPMLFGLFEGELLLAEGLPDSAIRVVRATPVIGPRIAIGWRMPLYNLPHDRDVVPRAFQRKGQPDSAIAEYERMLTLDPATLDRRLINPVFHYRLAKLCDQTGRTEKAVAEYRRFLELWSKADRELPELIDARKRLSVLAQRR